MDHQEFKKRELGIKSSYYDRFVPMIGGVMLVAALAGGVAYGAHELKQGLNHLTDQLSQVTDQQGQDGTTANG